MIILAIETTGPKASVALINENGDITEKTSDEEVNHLRGLVPMIKELIDEYGCAVSDIRYVAASVGPGSFTGIRIGVATARALAQAWTVQTISVPTLESFVYNIDGNNAVTQGNSETTQRNNVITQRNNVITQGHSETTQSNNVITQRSNYDKNGIKLICPIFDARRSQIYSGAYYLDNGKPRTLLPGAAWEFELFFETLTGLLKEQDGKYKEIVFFGDGLCVFEENIHRWTQSLDPRIETATAAREDRYQKASSVARMAYVLMNEGACGHYSGLLPVYMRKAEAERRREALGESSGISGNGKA